MTKRIYIDTHNSHVNQHLAHFVIAKQLSVCDKIKLFEYKLIYLTQKTWVHAED